MSEETSAHKHDDPTRYTLVAVNSHILGTQYKHQLLGVQNLLNADFYLRHKELVYCRRQIRRALCTIIQFFRLHSNHVFI